MITLLDAETTFQKEDKKYDPSPFNPKNKLVSLGWRNEKERQYVCLYHSEEPPTPHAKDMIQNMLSETTILVAHNAKFDLQWLLECGFQYSNPVWCTMVVQYVLNCGLKLPLDLENCCKQHRLEVDTKLDTVKALVNQGVSFENISWEYIVQYGEQDIDLLEGLFLAQLKELNLTTTSLIKLVRNSMWDAKMFRQVMTTE